MRWTQTKKQKTMSIQRGIVMRDVTTDNPETEDLTLECLSEEGSVIFDYVGTVVLYDVEYKVNDGEYETYTLGDEIALTEGDKVSFRVEDEIERLSLDILNFYNFGLTGTFRASGDVTSLIGRSETIGEFCFCKLFEGCDGLLSLPLLPTEVMANGCYYQFAKDCHDLVEPAVLPSMHLAVNCYYGFYDGCTSLLRASDLPALELEYACYSDMYPKWTYTHTATIFTIKMSQHCGGDKGVIFS